MKFLSSHIAKQLNKCISSKYSQKPRKLWINISIAYGNKQTDKKMISFHVRAIRTPEHP